MSYPVVWGQPLCSSLFKMLLFILVESCNSILKQISSDWAEILYTRPLFFVSISFFYQLDITHCRLCAIPSLIFKDLNIWISHSVLILVFHYRELYSYDELDIMLFYFQFGKTFLYNVHLMLSQTFAYERRHYHPALVRRIWKSLDIPRRFIMNIFDLLFLW